MLELSEMHQMNMLAAYYYTLKFQHNLLLLIFLLGGAYKIIKSDK